jgi:hypothetical protein
MRHPKAQTKEVWALDLLCVGGGNSKPRSRCQSTSLYASGVVESFSVDVVVTALSKSPARYTSVGAWSWDVRGALEQ